ncbi:MULTISPECIES: hypothetical protein [unclassified Bradyrhizobium]|uniref:hypothetical protein n=1 Tax=unclassified Bradyrhizobium TaxID=2631580 RepID=UPI0029171325|nr:MULTISPECIES: hypothetical protein [unclassified Bradyrhizobium]
MQRAAYFGSNPVLLLLRVRLSHTFNSPPASRPRRRVVMVRSFLAAARHDNIGVTGDVARVGAFVILNHDGSIRIERGFIRPEDDKAHPEAGEDGY